MSEEVAVREISQGEPVVNRYRLLDAIRPLQASERQRCCRRKRIAPEVQLVLRHDGTRSLQGICRCGSAVCPVCAPAIYAERADEIQHACETWRLAGGEVLLLTSTIRHALGDDLGAMLRGLSDIWRRVRGGRAGKALWDSLGIAHSVRATETTYGEHGWHPHQHTLLFMRQPGMAAAVERTIGERWATAVVSVLGGAHVPDEHGTKVTLSTVDTYIAKLGLEVSSITSKRGRAGLGPWQLAQLAATGDSDARIRWAQYSAAMLGRQRIAWSKGARKTFGLDESTDELAMMAAEQAAGVEHAICTWPAADWDAGCRRSRTWTSDMMVPGVAEHAMPAIARHGIVQDPERPRPPRLLRAERREPLPDLAKARARQEDVDWDELYPERAWYERQRALGKLRERMRKVIA